MIENLKELIEYPKKGITSKQVFKMDRLDITLFSMSANTNISDHTSTKKGFVYVIEGNGTFVLEGKKIPMKDGVFISMKENQVHSLSSKENTSFLLCLS